MKIFRLHASSTEILGILCSDDDTEVCKTLERPWEHNERRVSCIPAGSYVCRRRWSNHFKCELFEITGVPDRSDVLLHPANYVTELLGCVALGRSYADLNNDGTMDLASSRDAFAHFMAMMAGIDEFPLTIKDAL